MASSYGVGAEKVCNLQRHSSHLQPISQCLEAAPIGQFIKQTEMEDKVVQEDGLSGGNITSPGVSFRNEDGWSRTKEDK